MYMMALLSLERFTLFTTTEISKKHGHTILHLFLVLHVTAFQIYIYRFCFGFVAPCLAVFAVMFSMIGSFFCETVKFTASGEWVGTIDFTPTDVHIGPWSQKDTVLVSRTNLAGDTYYYVRDVCTNFSGEVDIDSKWKAVRAFSIMTPIIGGLLAFLILLTNCTYYLSASTWKNVMVLFGVILPLFQGLSFLLLSSNACGTNPLLSSNPSQDTVTNEEWIGWIRSLYPDEECSWDVGMTMNVLSTVLYFGTACCMYYTGVPTQPPQPPPETQEVTYERTVGPDGTVTVAQTKVVKGTAVPDAVATTEVVYTKEQPV